MVTKVLKTSQEIISAYEAARPKTTLDLLALYCSQNNNLIQDKALIGIPITDPLISGWGVFDTLNIYNSVPYQMSSHIDRLLNSAFNSKIPIAFSKPELESKVEEIVSKFPNSRIRLFISGSGHFFILAYTDVSQNKPTVIREVTVNIPTKPVFLSVIKTTNYLVNALCVLEAREKDGYMGIFLDDDGYLAESAVANIAIVYQGKFLMPIPKNILEGTTAKRVFQYCEGLISSGEVKGVERTNITPEMAQNAEEMMMLGGDSVISISHFNNIALPDAPGPVTSLIFRFLDTDKKSYLDL